jgi:glyoxylase-like metal-dependent hydrolase (beta-lactamase superfamily II)
VLAPNPGPMTLDGTNTWLLAVPGARDALLVDPGPDDPVHRAAVLAAAEARGVRIRQILLTHGHPDHSEGARPLAEAVRAPVRALDPAHRIGPEGLHAGDRVALGDLRVEVVATPGHTADCLSFLLPDDGAVLTGDTVLGRGSTVVAHPEGRLADYLASLERLRELARVGAVTRVLPGHGPALADAVAALEYYLSHRRQRLEQIRAARAAGARTAREVLERVYVDVDRALWPAAELSVRAQLAYLDAEDEPAG